MKKGSSFVVLLMPFILIQACQNSPTTPPATNMNVRSISVTSRSGVEFSVGETAEFTAIATMSDGYKRIITGGAGTWSSSNSSVAMVDGSGAVTMVGMGRADIIMTYNGKSGSVSILVRGQWPDYRGTWAGTYSINGCEASGDFETKGFCGAFTGPGFPINLVLTQDFNEVWGQVQLGSFSGSAVADLYPDGKLRLDGIIPADPYAIAVVAVLQLADSGQMTGTMTLAYTAAGWDGEGLLGCNITSLARTSVPADAKAFAGQPSRKTGTLAEPVNPLKKR